MGIRLIQVPYDSGYRDRRMGRGPARLVDAGALGRLSARGTPVRSVVVDAAQPPAPEVALAFELHGLVAAQVRSAVADGDFPLLLAGNCNATLGALAGLVGVEREVALIWFDAHGDLHTPETTRSGFLDGMALGMITGACWSAMTGAVEGFRPLAPDLVALVGARDLDEAERVCLAASAIRVVDGDAVAARGARALDRALDAWSGRVAGFYVHVDLDVHDGEAGRFNAYQPAAGGLSASRVRSCLEAIAGRGPILGCTLSAYDPACDADGRAAATACDLLACVAKRVGPR